MFRFIAGLLVILFVLMLATSIVNIFKKVDVGVNFAWFIVCVLVLVLSCKILFFY